jgi:hypothetical protein
VELIATRRELDHMGIFDHRKTWRFRVNGPPQDCVAAFTDAFSGGAHIMKAKWDISRSGNGAVATYRGRAGVMKALTVLSSRASDEEAGAIGSQVTFEVEDIADGAATCAMWLSSGSKSIGFTADGRFFRPYMRAVEDHLRQIDPALQVAKD